MSLQSHCSSLTIHHSPLTFFNETLARFGTYGMAFGRYRENLNDMKIKIIRSLGLLALTVLFSSSLFAQEKDQNKLKELVESKSFVFKAQTASPMGGSLRQLTGEYDLRLQGNAVTAYLPYFGRTYTAPAPGASGGIDFSTSKFEYSYKARKKGGWEVTILPKEVSDVRQLFLTISENGYGTLQVSSNSRQPISFNGYIAEKK